MKLTRRGFIKGLVTLLGVAGVGAGGSTQEPDGQVWECELGEDGQWHTVKKVPGGHNCMLWRCGRCGAWVTDEDREFCWYCQGPLCLECWEEHGHCGHASADQIVTLRHRLGTANEWHCLDCGLVFKSKDAIGYNYAEERLCPECLSSRLRPYEYDIDMRDPIGPPPIKVSPHMLEKIKAAGRKWLNDFAESVWEDG